MPGASVSDRRGETVRLPSAFGGIDLGSGASWMRSEPEAGSVLLAAEQFLLDFGYEPEGWEGDHPVYDPANESRWRLVWALTEGSDLSNEDRERIYTEVALKRERPKT